MDERGDGEALKGRNLGPGMNFRAHASRNRYPPISSNLLAFPESPEILPPAEA